MTEKKHKSALDEGAEHSIPVKQLPFEQELRAERLTYSLPTTPAKREVQKVEDKNKLNQSGS